MPRVAGQKEVGPEGMRGVDLPGKLPHVHTPTRQDRVYDGRVVLWIAPVPPASSAPVHVCKSDTR